MRAAFRAWVLVGLVAVQGCAQAAGTPSPSAIPTGSASTPVGFGSPTPGSASLPNVSAAPEASAAAAPTSPASPSPAGASGCTTASIDYAADAKGAVGDPAVLARAALKGLVPSDRLTASGNGTAEQTVLVLRGGLQVAELNFVHSRDGGWLLDVATLCNGLGLR